MKALTLWQPWASLMADGHKRVETRSWDSRYRGPIVIHAAKHVPAGCGASELSFGFREFYCSAYDIPRIEYELHAAKLPKGSILCIANLIAIEETTKVYSDLSTMEKIFGNYDEGRFAWFFEDVRKIEPIECAGNRLLWNVPKEIEGKL